MPSVAIPIFIFVNVDEFFHYVFSVNLVTVDFKEFSVPANIQLTVLLWASICPQRSANLLVISPHLIPCIFSSSEINRTLVQSLNSS